MTRPVLASAGFALMAALASGTPAIAAPPKAADLAAIQQQLNALRGEYDAKITALEARLKVAEDQVAASHAAAPIPDPVVGDEVSVAEIKADPEPVVHMASANASNPGVSVVLNGNYVAMSRDPAGARISGFSLSDDARLPGRGFSLGESEITLASNVDPFFTANLTASFSADNQVSVEEAYVQTTALPAGLTIRAGRFFSAIGYLNERHAHNWSFIDMPLPYRALLGKQ